MNDMWRGLTSLSVKESDYFNDNHEKFEIVGGCPVEESACLNYLSAINKSFASSHSFHLSKDYPRSIESLKYAYTMTSKMEDSFCKECIDLFRSSIIQSLENIHDDLRRMTTGFIMNKRFKPSYDMASMVLEELKNF